MKFDVLSPGSSHRLVLNMSGSTSTASHRLTPLHHQDSRLGDYVFVPRLKVCLKQAYLRLDQRSKALRYSTIPLNTLIFPYTSWSIVFSWLFTSLLLFLCSVPGFGQTQFNRSLRHSEHLGLVSQHLFFL